MYRLTLAVTHSRSESDLCSYMYGMHGGSVFSRACLYARNEEELSIR